MDPPPTGSSSSSAVTNKLRLMCSYGGHITSRPQTKSLYYAGGDTRLISIPGGDTTLSSLMTHLASTLHFTSNYPFMLKYQLPNHDLDSLISLSTDEDLLLMLDEHHRLSASSSSRIRLFLFPAKSNPHPRCALSGGNQLSHPKTESWFADVLKSAELMQKGGVGYGGDGHSEGNNGSFGGGGGEVNSGGGLCGAESLVLETSSSLGSSSSSAVSFQNLPAKAQFEDKIPLSDAIASDNTVATAVSHPQTGTYQDLITPSESENKMFDPQIGAEMHRNVQVSGIPMSYQYDQPQQVVFVHTSPHHYVPQNQPSIRPMSTSYYHMGSPMPQQPMYYQTNHPPPPVYFLPVGHNPYNFPPQSSLVTPATISSSRPPAYPNPSSAQVAYKVATDSPPVPEIASSQVYITNQVATTAHVNANHRHAGMSLQAQSTGITSLETANYTNELDDDVVNAQIYKSQPPAPALPSQYQTMTKATAGAMLSDALAQLHMENTNQQLRTSHPQ